MTSRPYRSRNGHHFSSRSNKSSNSSWLLHFAEIPASLLTDRRTHDIGGISVTSWMVVVHIKSTMADSASNSDVNLDELTLRLTKAPTVVSASGNPNACLIQIHPIDDKLGSLFPVAGKTLVIGRD